MPYRVVGSATLVPVSEQPSLPGPHDMRASNGDRERFAKVLHDAMAEGRLTVTELEERLDQVYAARTFGELEPLVRDLPNQQLVAYQASLPQPVTATDPARVGGRGTSSSAVAIMSGSERKGHWTIPPTFNAFAMMGGVEIDLTQATFEAAETVIHAFTIMGGIEITVPPDVTVYVTGSGFMGGFSNTVRTQAPPGSPVVRITGMAIMGGVEVKPPKKPKKNKEIQEG
ncbi:cell wall-active antibiotic response 4TMS protein YvqF [Actinokineospora cianjurensis]|uniref:Cell wall-active antibiotic response 4TMS protein YvqF n=1 Tax=Actinokineospora cianjurensis TaxID=585224 RepID=A0A421BA09_9PSEU|nr:cell wall-active antibiotic response 4TMS protein YvqF [Actinokineospora cianjurensis]